MRREAAWLAAAVGLLPTLMMVAVHLWVHPAGMAATGFLQYDQPYYMANAREHFDGGFHLLYGLPFSDNPATPRIYVQPHLLLLGVVQHLTGVAPGWLYLGFGLLAALGCLRVLASLFAGTVQSPAAAWRPVHWLAWLLLCWGGGLLALAGVGSGLATGEMSADVLLRFDPEGGWWFLNLGRNFLYPVEAYYHLLTFAVVLSLWHRRWGPAVALLALISASHPFTGVKTLLVVLAWSGLERLVLRRREVPLWLPAAAALILAAHLGYYLGFLSRSPEHRVLAAYWMEMPWTLSLGNALLAFALPGWFAYRRLSDERRNALADPRVRLWAVLALVTLGLAEHDLIIAARQPIHFVRGYLYTALFFLGLPALLGTLDGLWRRKAALDGLWRRRAALAMLVALFLSDNAVWYAIKTTQAAAGDQPFGWYLSRDQRDLFEDLTRLGDADALLVSDDVFTAYLAQTYTPVRAWFSHRFNTPHAIEHWRTLNVFFNGGGAPPEWQGRRLFIVAGAHWWDGAAPAWWDAATMRRIARHGETVLVERAPPSL